MIAEPLHANQRFADTRTSVNRRPTCIYLLKESTRKKIVFDVVINSGFQGSGGKRKTGSFPFIHIGFGEVLILVTQISGHVDVFDIDRNIQSYKACFS